MGLIAFRSTVRQLTDDFGNIYIRPTRPSFGRVGLDRSFQSLGLADVIDSVALQPVAFKNRSGTLTLHALTRGEGGTCPAGGGGPGRKSPSSPQRARLSGWGEGDMGWVGGGL